MENHEGRLVLQDVDELKAVWMLANRTFVSKVSNEQLKASAERLAIAAGKKAMENFNNPSAEVKVHLGLEDTKWMTDAASHFTDTHPSNSDDPEIYKIHQKIAEIKRIGASEDQ